MLSLQIEWSHNSFHILFAYSIQQKYGHSLGKWSQRIIFELLKFHARSFLLTYKIQIHARPESFKGIFNFKELQVDVLSYVLYRKCWRCDWKMIDSTIYYGLVGQLTRWSRLLGLAEWVIIRTLLALFDLTAAKQRPSKSHSVSHIVVIL